MPMPYSHSPRRSPAAGSRLVEAIARAHAEAGGEGRVDAMYAAGYLAYQAKKYDEAEPLLVGARDAWTRELGEEHDDGDDAAEDDGDGARPPTREDVKAASHRASRRSLRKLSKDERRASQARRTSAVRPR